MTRDFDCVQLRCYSANMLARPLLIAAFSAIALATARVHADEAQRREDQFKAAYLFNFVKFVEWPSATDTVNVCFLGAEGVHHALASSIQGKGAGARKVLAQRIEPSTGVEHCQVLYADATSVNVLLAAGSLAAGAPVLTVSDAPQFATSGGMIELYTENHRLRFVINVARANKAGLRISSDLLKLAAAVRREEP